MADLVFSDAEKAFLVALNTAGIRFLIVGLSGAVIQGAPVVTQDVDLWIEQPGSPDFLSAIKSVGAFYIAPGTAGMNPPAVGPERFSLFDIVTHAHGLESFVAEYDRSQEVTVDGVKLRVLPLERIILSKKTANREKDRVVLPALEATLAVLRSTSRDGT